VTLNAHGYASFAGHFQTFHHLLKPVVPDPHRKPLAPGRWIATATERFLGDDGQ
jgi:hypothetical protein